MKRKAIRIYLEHMEESCGTYANDVKLQHGFYVALDTC